LGLGLLVGDVIMGAGFRAFLAKVTLPRAPTEPLFGPSFFWKLGYNPSFSPLDWLSSISGAFLIFAYQKDDCSWQVYRPIWHLA